MGMVSVGAILLMFGLLLLYVTNLRRVAAYVARETAPAMQMTSTAFGRGFGGGI